ncbi:MAG TPA: hypothetical protein VGR34_06415 [Candidatus Dormibacteraeota bacterium]|nr:hypothetical protein [Candidatus Dormibacteraeota bacterium]
MNLNYRAKVEATWARKGGLSREARKSIGDKVSRRYWRLSLQERQAFNEKRMAGMRAAKQRRKEKIMELSWRQEEEILVKQMARAERIDRVEAIRRLRASWLIGETSPPGWPPGRAMPRANPRS